MNAFSYSQGTHDKHDKYDKHVNNQQNNKGINPDPKARQGHGRLLLLVLVSVGRVLLMLSEVVRSPSRT
jgi:hypothetical protein